MPPENREMAYLWDMRETAQEIVSFVANVKFADFANNKMIRHAVERQLFVIGEAANHMPETFQENCPEIPWRQVIGLRNVLAREYGEIKVDRIYNAAKVSVPNLLLLLNKLLPAGD